MNEAKQYSSLPLALSASLATVVCAGAGWFLLGETPATPPPATIDAPAQSPPVLQAALPIDPLDDAIATSAIAKAGATPPGTAKIDVGSELRKARLAANADMLVSPLEQSALYFYERVLSAEPGHETANREADTVLARISLNVMNELAAGNLQAAYDVAIVVARIRPDHALVTVTQQTINDRANRIAATAAQLATSGDNQGAGDALAQLNALPGVQPEFVASTRDAISSAQLAFIAAESDRIEREQLAAEEAVNEWTSRVRGAIKSGQLVAPVGDNARDYLAERSAPKDKAEELTDELVAALLEQSAQHVDGGEPLQAELLVSTASELRPGADGLAAMRDRVEREIIQSEESRVLALSDFVSIDTPPARYPRTATARNLTGWVDVMFTVTQTGTTTDIEVVQSEPVNVFDESAVAAVEQWRFQPRMFRGQFLNQRASARLAFRLE